MSSNLDIVVKVKRLRNNKNEVKYATSGSAGIDLIACIDAPIIINPGQRAMIPTGVAVQLPSKHLATMIFSRSGLGGKYGISMANGVGVIDSDYRGEIICPLQNNSNEDFIIKPGERVGQMIFMPVALAALEFVDELDETQRGDGGFGSTGK